MTASAAPLMRFIAITIPSPKPDGGCEPLDVGSPRAVASVVFVTLALMISAFVALTVTAP